MVTRCGSGCCGSPSLCGSLSLRGSLSRTEALTCPRWMATMRELPCPGRKKSKCRRGARKSTNPTSFESPGRFSRLLCCVVSHQIGGGTEHAASCTVEQLECSAARGDAWVQQWLGNMYHLGDGIEPDISRALELWEFVAAQGYAGAEFNIGVSHYNGVGRERDATKGVELRKQAAAKGFIQAQVNLEGAYFDAIGTARDRTKAIGLWEHAARSVVLPASVQEMLSDAKQALARQLIRDEHLNKPCASTVVKEGTQTLQKQRGRCQEEEATSERGVARQVGGVAAGTRPKQDLSPRKSYVCIRMISRAYVAQDCCTKMSSFA